MNSRVRLLAFGLAGVLLAAACSASSAPRSTEGFASLFGSVRSAGGVTLANRVLHVSCAMGTTETETTSDSLGRYGVNVVISPAIMDRFGPATSCELTTLPSSGMRVDEIVAVRFFAPGVPHPAQLVDLIEDSAVK